MKRLIIIFALIFFSVINAFSADSENTPVWNFYRSHITNSGWLPSDFAAITFGNNRFLAVDQWGEVYSSEDGYSWAKHRDGSHILHGVKSVAFGNGGFVAATDGGGASLQIADFDREAWEGWQVFGTAFGPAPELEIDDQKFYSPTTSSSPYPYRVANSFNSPQRGAATGRLLSPEFTIDAANITLWMAGANHPDQVEVRLLVGGSAVRTQTGDGSGVLSPATWDVRNLIGQNARIEIVDNASGPQSWIAVEKIQTYDPDGGILFRSDDGVRWQKIPHPAIQANQLPQYGEQITTLQGPIVLDESRFSGSQGLNAITWDGSLWIAVGGISARWRLDGGGNSYRSDSHPLILSSTNGTVWTREDPKRLPFARDYAGRYELQAVAGTGTATVVAGAILLKRVSPNSDWEEAAAPHNLPVRRVVAAGGGFALANIGNAVWISESGGDFDKSSSFPNNGGLIRGLEYGNGWFTTTGWRNYFSQDGSHWAESTTANHQITNVAFGKNRFVGVGAHGIIGVAEIPVPEIPVPIPAFAQMRTSGTALSNLVFQPNGRLGLLLGHDLVGTDSIERRRAVFAEWNLVSGSAPFNAAQVAPPVQFARQMLLLASPAGNQYALVNQGGQIGQWVLQGGNWAKLRNINISADIIEACVGPDEAIHFAYYDNSDWDSNQVFLRYARLASNGALTSEAVASLENIIDASEMNDFDDLVDYGTHIARNLGITLGTDGTVHIIYSGGRSQNEIFQGGVLIGTEIRSSLFHAKKPLGSSWVPQEILKPPTNGYGDYGGLGASIATAPDGRIGVAASIIPRARTGSPGVASLVFTSNLSGTPSWETVDSQSAGYRMGDGERGTGLFPKLVFDQQGRGHIAYTDHASEHFAGRGAKSFSGQIRYARQNAARTVWDRFTALSSGGVIPMNSQVFHPSLAVRVDGTAVIAANVFRWSPAKASWNRSLFLQQVPGRPTRPVAPPAAPSLQSTQPTQELSPLEQQIQMLEERLASIRKRVKNPAARAAQMRRLRIQINNLKRRLPAAAVLLQFHPYVFSGTEGFASV